MPRTASEASRLLSLYESLNSDLPPEIRRQLALFVLAPTVGKKGMEELFDRPLGQTVFRHRAWMWATAIQTADLGRWWPLFRDTRNEKGTQQGLHALKEKVTYDQWVKLSDRLGRRVIRSEPSLNPYDWTDTGPPQDIWTAGGTWHKQNNYTRIIILGETLDRDYTFNALAEALGPRGAASLGREIANTIDPESLLYPDAIRQAVGYARVRIPQLIGRKIDNAGWKTLSWFFQAPVPVGSKWVNFKSEANYPVSRNKHNQTYLLDWLPGDE